MGPMEPAPAPPERVSGDDAVPETVRCTWCQSDHVEKIGEWGPQLLAEQWMCLSCRSPFEWIRRR
ncbi:MAG: hypothetical protein QOF29_3088 [bacterium]